MTVNHGLPGVVSDRQRQLLSLTRRTSTGASRYKMTWLRLSEYLKHHGRIRTEANTELPSLRSTLAWAKRLK